MSKAQATRSDILKRAMELIYKKGFQSTSIDDILATTQVTKGAFYYHFKNKEEMGIALIEEAMPSAIWPDIEKSLSFSPNFRNNIYDMMNKLLFNHSFMTVEYGCPAVNLIQEMAPLNEAFRVALRKSLNKWEKAIEAELIRGQTTGQLGGAHDTKQIVLNIMTLYHGVRNMGKLLGKPYYISFLSEFRRYLDSLK